MLLNAARSLPYNRDMSHLDILLPFGLPPAEMAADLIRQLNTPALATLLARAKPLECQAFDGFSRALPHETWAARQFGLEAPLRAGDSPPIAQAAMQTLGLTPESGVWFMLQPVHLHVARDHLVLSDLRQLDLSEQDSRALFDVAKPLFDEAGNTLVYGDAQTWFARADDWQDMQTSTPDAACGHNIDIWMPKGMHARDWRRLQNEVQMHWHTHPVNEKREARGLKPVNSIWLWGGTPPSMNASPGVIKEAVNLPGWMKAFNRFASRQVEVDSAAELIAATPQHGLLVLDALIGPALAGDWAEWLARLQALDIDWFAPLLDALKSGRIDQLSLVFSDNTGLSPFAASRQSLRKFWVKPSLARLSR